MFFKAVNVLQNDKFEHFSYIRIYIPKYSYKQKNKFQEDNLKNVRMME